MDLRDRLVLLRAHVVVVRARRRYRAELERELSAHSTRADRDDLLAALDRYPDAVAQQYRDILTRPARRDPAQHWPAMGRWAPDH